MKKAKIMLMAIAVTGVVGGALAFKAKNFSPHVFYSLNALKNSCNVTVSPDLTTTVAPFGNIQTTYFTTQTATVGGFCPPTRVIAAP